jgi:hypothetical protein
MRQIAGGVLVLLLALPATWADDKPKDKDSEKPATPKEQYGALVKEFNAKRSEVIQEIQKAKGPAQQKLIQKYVEMGKDFADQFYKLAEATPNDPVATDAIFWVLQNGAGSDAHKKAVEKVGALVKEMPLKDLSQRVRGMMGANPQLMETVFARAEKEEKDPLAGDLLVWIATNGSFFPIGQKATDRLVEKYPEHPGIERLCESLGRGNNPKAEQTLKQILDKGASDKVKVAAAMGLGRVLAAKTDTLGDKPEEADKVAAEAEKYFVMVTDKFAAENPARKMEAERELKVLRTLRVGKEAPDIKAGDLDEKEFKLSDYRGKVVLLDFWGHW